MNSMNVNDNDNTLIQRFVFASIREEGAMRRIDELPAKWIMARERLNVYNKARSIHCQYLTGEISGSMV